jgi:hypothetical protein
VGNVGNAIPDTFSNPGISGLSLQNGIGIDYTADTLVTKGVKSEEKIIPTTVLLVHNATLANSAVAEPLCSWCLISQFFLWLVKQIIHGHG